jgi:hypothetical protein
MREALDACPQLPLPGIAYVKQRLAQLREKKRKNNRTRER